MARAADRAPAAIGTRPRQRRQSLGLSQRDLSEPGVSYAYISRIEAGARTPSVKALRKLAPKLGVSVEWLETVEQSPAQKLARLVLEHDGQPLPDEARAGSAPARPTETRAHRHSPAVPASVQLGSCRETTVNGAGSRSGWLRPCTCASAFSAVGNRLRIHRPPLPHVRASSGWVGRFRAGDPEGCRSRLSRAEPRLGRSWGGSLERPRGRRERRFRMSLPPRHWRVLVREHDGSESESTYEQPGGEPPPIPQVVIVVGGNRSRRVVVDDVSTVDPPPGWVGVIRARPVTSTPAD
jgi:transcriptional regulator with XRE-family HTH domain